MTMKEKMLVGYEVEQFGTVTLGIRLRNVDLDQCNALSDKLILAGFEFHGWLREVDGFTLLVR